MSLFNPLNWASSIIIAKVIPY